MHHVTFSNQKNAQLPNIAGLKGFKVPADHYKQERNLLQANKQWKGVGWVERWNKWSWNFEKHYYGRWYLLWTHYFMSDLCDLSFLSLFDMQLSLLQNEQITTRLLPEPHMRSHPWQGHEEKTWQARQIRSSGISKSFSGAHLKDDLCLSDACCIRLLPNFCDTGRRPSLISLQTEST